MSFGTFRRWAAGAALVATLSLAPSADAFCGFYVSGADAELVNNATVVVMMREGTKTALSMENNYEGPPEDFALVVPVPVVLQKENVKTLPPELFKRVDRLAAPRLVEYWEQDPCQKVRPRKGGSFAPGAPKAKAPAPAKKSVEGVKIEAQFVVGEYEIVILSADDSTGLDKWLKLNKYQIPDGAEPYLRPYVQKGMKFFVAKVDVAKVKFVDGRARLSPLRFHYEDDVFALPVRLGLINASGKQDLLVHILAQNKRYEVANYPNLTIPTNLDVSNDTREDFRAFYAALLDHTLEQKPGAVVTEYAWDSGSCDPCPTPALSQSELSTLGGDVLFDMPSAPDDMSPAPMQKPGIAPRPSKRGRPGGRMRPRRGMVLTRLHARYDKAALAEDLVFREAKGIVGGREIRRDGGKLEQGASESSTNTFQARYAIRHEWKGPIECENPRRGIWGAPPDGQRPETRAATDLAFAPRGKAKLSSFLTKGLPGASALPTPNDAPNAMPSASAKPPKSRDDDEDEDDDAPTTSKRDDGACGCRTAGGPSSGTWATAGVAMLAWLMRRRRRALS